MLEKINLRVLNRKEGDYWNRHISGFELSHPLNSNSWGRVRESDKWESLFIVAEKDGRVCGGMPLLVKRIPHLSIGIAYAPRGPVWKPGDDDCLARMLRFSISYLKSIGCIFLRIDPNIREDQAGNPTPMLHSLGAKRLPYRWSYWNAPRDEIRVNLDRFGHPDHYFKALASKTRNSIRKPYKHGVEFHAASCEEELKAFYDIFRKFSLQKGFLVRDFNYQRTLWKRFIEPGEGVLMLATLNGRIIGGASAVKFGGKCLGMHLGVVEDYIRLNAISAFYWETIKWCIETGCSWISFGGAATERQEIFKRKFFGEQAPLVGYYDFPINEVFYNYFKFMEFRALPGMFPFVSKMRSKFSKMG